MNLHFVTSNPNKFRELFELLECNLNRVELDLQEIQTTDLHELVKFKLRQAYEQVQAPVIVEDTSLYFEAWNELPGPLVKFFLKNLGLYGMVRVLDEFNNKSASAACCLGFTKDGKSMHLFEGKVKGVIVDASITISPTDPTKVNFMVNEGRYKNLYVQSQEGASGVKQMPSSLWESFKSEELVTRVGGAISVADMNEGVKKMEYCLVSGEG